MKIEYLIIIDSGNPFCRDKKSFDNFLQSNADITIQGKVFKHKLLEVEYELQGGETEADKNRFFHIKLVCKNDSRIEEFQDLLKSTRTLLRMASGKRNPQVLWDDVSVFYSKKAYPLIHEIENLMRKLITKFMLTNVGLGWTKDTIPEDLKKSPKPNSIENNNNYLYETDFKDLSTFLFDEYRTLDIKALNEKIKELETKGDRFSLNEFKGFIPKSNWERYFREYVDCNGEYLKVELGKIQDAINNLDKVEVPEDERDELAEIVAIKTNSLFGEYIQKWKQIEKILFDLCEIYLVNKTNKNIRYSPIILSKELVSSGRLEKTMYHELQEASKVRNIIVHESDHHFSPDDLLYRIANLDKILDSLTDLLTSVHDKKDNSLKIQHDSE